jgi:O-antigen/teichoic acid export membrane protein
LTLLRAARPRLKSMLVGYSWLLGGSGASLVLSALTFVFIARSLGPGNYGLYTAATAYLGLVGMLRLAGFDTILIRETAGSPEEGAELYQRFLGLYIICAGIVVAAAVLLMPLFSLRAGSEILVLILLPMVPLQAYSLAWIAVFTGRSAYRTMTVTDVIRQVAYCALVLVIALLPLPLGTRLYLLAGSLVVSYGVGFAARFMAVRRLLRQPLRPSWPRLPKAIWRGGLVLSLFSVLTILFSRVDILFANAWLTARDVGWYSVAQNGAGKGTSLIMLSGLVLFPALAASFKRGSTLSGRNLLEGSLLYGAAWTVVGGLLWVVAPRIIALLFGSEYLGAVFSFRILLIANLVFAIGFPLSTYVVASGSEMLLLIPLCVRAVTNVGGDWLVLALGGGIQSIAVVTIVASAAFSITLAIVFWRHQALTARGREQAQTGASST